MITLTVDPHSEVAPDFRTEDHRFTREAFAHGREGMSDEQAADALLNLWLVALDRRKAIWETEREEREAAGRVNRPPSRGDPPGQAVDDVTLPSRHSREHSPEIGERPPNLVAGMPVPDVIEYPPARFAIKKLREREYIELSYFTPDGRAEAAKNESVSSSEIFTLAKEDDVLSLKPVINFKASKGKALQDEDLAWDQVCVASTNFLEHIVQENWPVNMIDAMHAFFFRLTNHKLRNDGPEGLKVLILYQAWVRREWHRQIKNPPKVGIFDIGLIDDKVLRTLKDQIYDSKRSALMSGEFSFFSN